ncbi:Peptidase dimerization domain protein [compost metagenome]
MAQPIHAAARAVAKIADFIVPADPKTSFCVSNFHGGNDAGIHAIAPAATIKFNFRSNFPEELQKLDDRIFQAIEEACREETARWGQDTITWDKKIVGEVPGGTQSAHAPLVEAAYCGLKSLGIDPVFGKGGCTNANISISKGIPAICLGRAYAPDEESKNIKNHSIHEKFPLAGADKAVKLLFMTLLMAAGLDDQFDSIVEKRS